MKKRNILVAAGLGFAQLAFLNAAVFAQRQDSTSLNEVVVTASRSPKKIADIGKIVKVISQQEIERAQGRTLPELLNNVAGLNIAGSGSNPGGVQSVYLRGASAANTLILIDGIPVNDASGISGEYNLAAIDISQVERVEILKGASSTLYGSDAVAGVINVITKKGDQKFNAHALLTGGSYDTYKESVGLSGQIQNTKLAFTFSNLNSKSISSAKPGPAMANFEKDGFNQRSLGFNAKQYIGNSLSLIGGLQLNQNKADLDGGAFSDDVDYTYDKTALLAHVGAKFSLTKGDLGLTFSQNYVKNQFNNAPNITDNRGNISNVESIFSYQFSNILGITSGASYKYSSTDQKYVDPDYPSSLTANNHISSVYTSLFIAGGNFFRMELGGRYNNHSQYGDNFTYTLNPSLIINEQLKYYINVSSAYRVPSLYQLYSDYGNINLKPETARSYETGFEGSLLDNKVSFSASVFKRNGKDVIDFGEISSGVYGYVNQNKQNDKGMELELGFKPDDRMDLKLFYAYVDGEVKVSDATPASFNLFRRPKNSVGANLGYSFTPKFYAGLNYKWNDTRMDQYYDTSNFTVVNAELKAYHQLDAYFQYKANKKLSLFADLKNLFDTDYTEFAGYTAKGFNFNTGLSFNFN